MAKFAVVQAIKDFVASSIRFLKVFRQWDPSWQYQPSDPCFYHGVGYSANPDNPPAAGESPETHPTKWNIIGGAESGATSTPTPNRVTKFDETARLRSGGYAIEPDHVIRKRELNLRVTTLQLYSKKSLLMSNARQVLRRLRGWDLGIPYLSPVSEVYHFDNDVLNQKQQTSISIISQGDAPQIVGKDDLLNGIPLIPAIDGIPPYEVISKSLLGNFKILKTIPASENSTLDFWVRLYHMNNSIVFRFETPTDTLLMFVGLGDPEYNTAAPGDPVYSSSLPGDISYSIAQSSGSILEHRTPNGIASTVVLDAVGTDPAYDEPEPGSIPYSAAASGDPEYSVAKASSALVDIEEGSWLHIALVNTKTKIRVYIADKLFDFQKYSFNDQPVSVSINETMGKFNIDELFIDTSTALEHSAFLVNNDARIPYAALNYEEKWLILEAEDIGKVKTNLFETDAFITAVQEVVNNM